MSEDTIDQKIQDLDKTIEDYKSNLGINTKQQSSFTVISNIELSDLKGLSSEECAEYAVIASIFSLYIQNEINKHTSKNKWAQHNLNVIYGKYAKDYGSKYDKFEERSLRTNVENTYAAKLNLLIKDTNVYIESLNFISRKIENINQSLLELSRAKRKNV